MLSRNRVEMLADQAESLARLGVGNQVRREKTKVRIESSPSAGEPAGGC